MTTIPRALAALARVPSALLAWLGLLLAVPLAVRSRLTEPDAGMSTAEYAVGTVAAVAFAAVRKTTSHAVSVIELPVGECPYAGRRVLSVDATP